MMTLKEIKKIKKVPFLERGDFYIVKIRTHAKSTREKLYEPKLCKFLNEYPHFLLFKELSTGYSVCVNKGDIMCGDGIVECLNGKELAV